MYKIKEFSDSLSYREFAIIEANKWLEKNNGKIKPISIARNKRYGEYAIGSITILYEEL